MGVFGHAQTSFAKGELSARLLGQFAAEIYGKGLSLCRNWMVLPQGPLLMRAGSVRAGAEAALPRLFNFRSSSSEEDWVIAVSAGHLRIRTRNGLITGDSAELVQNGNFSAGLANWDVVSGDVAVVVPYFYSGGYAARLGYKTGNIGLNNGGRLRQSVAVQIGHTYRARVSAVFSSNVPALRVRVGSTVGGGEYFDRNVGNLTPLSNQEISFTATTATVCFDFDLSATTNLAAYVGLKGDLRAAPISLMEVGAVVDLAAPWTVDQLELLQVVPEPAKDKLYLFHPNVQPRVLSFTAPATWALDAAVFTNPPAEWAGTNWPGFGEMFQGRLVAGATPAQPNTIWGSVPGQPLNFSMGSTASDAYTYVISTKGKLRWAQGQKALLMGADFTEHSAVGQGGIITSSDIDVRDESAWGSAAIPALHLGDQIVFVSRERRHVRSMSYSLQDNGWISRALTFLADHITEGQIQEIAFARSPQPILLALKANGEIAAATYDRAEQVIAWWRIAVGDSVRSMAVADGPDGSWLWLAVERSVSASNSIEYLPLHEKTAVYCDSSVSGQVTNDGTFGGLGHLEGRIVRVIVAGELRADQVVAAGAVAVDVADAGKAIVVGLGYRATAKTLKPEGGNPRGTAQGTTRRRPKVYVRVNDSALPLVNDERPDGAAPVVPMDTADGRVSGDFEYPGIDAEEDGQVTIEQDLPFRTEVLAVFGPVQVNDV